MLVYKVFWRHRWYALKEVTGIDQQKFYRELEVLATLRHPKLVCYFVQAQIREFVLLYFEHTKKNCEKNMAILSLR